MDHQQQQQYLASQQPHLSQGQSYAPQSSTASSIAQYPSYPSQPPVLQPAPHPYAPSQSQYPQSYPYSNGIPSPHSSSQSVGSHSINAGLPSLPTMTGGGAATFVGNPNGPQPSYQQQTPDTTGQVAPTGMKPRVTATLWEDEGCMCYQIEAKGICVARRDDNHFVNGTKLLNVAGMTRGRRDGILKSEKTRNVVKIGPMHLKGVWIPFDRALDFANKEKITESLYPLFVHNVGALLYHPTNQNRTNAVINASLERRRLDGSKPGGMVGPAGSQPPNLTHHHTMNSTVGGQQPSSLATHAGAGRPTLDRAHTFPTPPTSASGTVASGMGSQWSTYGAGASDINSGQVQQFEHHPHSTPATPATTPPGANLPSMQPYQSHQQSYDASRPMYSAAASQQSIYSSQLPNQSMARNGSLQSNGYSKDMGPPIGSSTKSESDHGDQKLASYIPHHDHGHGGGEEEAEHEHDTDYAHEPKYSYEAQRAAQFNGISMGANGYQNGSGHVASQASPANQSLWAAGHQTPPRAPPSSNLYNTTSDTRGALPNGNVASDGHVAGAYAPTQMNGATPSNKRLRDDDDAYSKSHSDDIDTLKRRKMGREGSSAGLSNGEYDDLARVMNRAKSSASVRSRR